ncbi:unnamed protein product [Cylicocyclus nassatus]|uniref:Uncharacterized protein n=1 Tax=Cylicocyclus nassatus TaxID=53992 RepID=A0AA36HEE5_CYLNA|nr:unnamed protein product [Cylicocyclus nassatus]
MLSAAISFLVVASSWAMLPVITGEHGHAPHNDDEHSDQKGIHPPYNPEPPMIDHTRQSAQVINNYYIFAKEITKLFDVKNGALPWSPPAKSAKREDFETDGKPFKLPERVIPQMPNLPPAVEKVEHLEQPDFFKGLMQSLGLLLNPKISELDGGPRTSGAATPLTVDLTSRTDSLPKSNWKYSELSGEPETTETATPVTGDMEESSNGTAQPSVKKSPETETDYEDPPFPVEKIED